MTMRLTHIAVMLVLAGWPAIAAAYVPPPAQTRRATFTGHLDFGVDVTGEFGAPMTDLTGMSWTASFIFNPLRGNRTTVPGLSDTVQGGPSIPPTFQNPVLRASFTLQGVTRDFSPHAGSLANIGATTFAPILLPGVLALNSDGYRYTATQSFQHSLYMSAFTTQPLAGSFTTSFAQRQAEAGGGGLFQLWTFDQNNVLTNQARGGLVVETFALSAVPEPASWLMLVSGFAMAGAALRRRQAVSA